MFRLNLPNIITFSRIFGVAYIFWLVPFVHEKTQLIAILVFTVIAITDAIDGWLARRMKAVTELGKVLDPLADKILLLVLLPLLTMGLIGAFPVFLIFTREFSVMGIRVLAAKRNFSIAASLSGKIKTGLTLPVCGLLFARPVIIQMADIPFYLAPIVELKRWVFSWPPGVFDGLIWGIVFVTWVSFFDYLTSFMWQRQLLRHRQNKEKAKQAMLSYIPNTITIANMVCGFIAIGCSLYNYLELAIAFILIGMIFDGLDGKIARKLNVYSEFGEKIDTRADYVTFGFAPAVLLFMYFFQYKVDIFVLCGFMLAFVYFFCIHYRLKRFEDTGHQPFFQGIPAPIGASFLVACLYSLASKHIVGLLLCIALLCWLLVSKLKYPHSERVGPSIVFKFLKGISLIVIFLIILQSFNVFHFGYFLYSCLFGLSIIYFLMPFYVND